MDKVVVVMPAWNEAENLKLMIDTLFEDEFPKIKAEIHLLIVDNYSKDGTEELVKGRKDKYENLHIIQQGDKKGLGNAYIAGFKHAM